MDSKFTDEDFLARWLDNRLTNEEQAELENSGELNNLKAVVDDIGTWKVEKFNVNKGLEDLKKRKKLVITPAPQRKQSKIHWLSIAASVLFLLTAGYFTVNYFITKETTITTEIAETKSITLPDGSVVEIDALSKVTYQKKDWENNRTITLDGQAFFDVTKGRPFKVVTETGSINVLGTQFNVNARAQIFEVKCYEGKVKVFYNTDAEILTKGESVIAKADHLINNTHTSNAPDWLKGFSKYNETKLLDVVNDLELYYEVHIELPSKYQDLQFTGTLTHKDLYTALETLFTSMEISYKVNNNSVTVN
ncbi:FecR family protein [Winogradskyella endarachnes]|uniref:DUF4974 domain-containing protein n=1 Tax=Winogradskyella endarachnes TaxID=2681965 RepID=A0A6L6U4Q7_9FLAO|nr:FecR family protein [Winogradskyella endarachnes]MUU77093.1 DUF4974 domain-containing protein [Winogradskyella endarachnes]